MKTTVQKGKRSETVNGSGKSSRYFNVHVSKTNKQLKNLVLIYFKFNPELIIISSGYDACIGCFEVSKFYFLLPGVNLKLITVLNIRGF